MSDVTTPADISLPITPEIALQLVLTSQTDDLATQSVLTQIDTMTTAYLKAAGYSPASTPPPDAKTMVYVANMTTLMETFARGIVTLRLEYRDMAKVSDAAMTAKVTAIQNLQSLGPLTGDNLWSKAITALGGAGLMTSLQATATKNIMGSPGMASKLSAWAVAGIVGAMVVFQVIVWFAVWALTARADKAQESSDQAIWRELVRQKLEAACTMFLSAAVNAAKKVSSGYSIGDPRAVVDEALALSNPGICIASDMSKQKRDNAWALDRRQGDVAKLAAKMKAPPTA